MVAAVRPAGAGARAGRRPAALRDAGRDPAADPGRRRRGHRSPAACTRAAGRLTGVHYGTYDYSAALGIAAQYQSMEHPAADHARAVMQVAAAGTGVRLSDGSSNVLPVGSPRRGARGLAAARPAGPAQSLERGFYQGWDLHPAQLVSRYAATYGFFRAGLAVACDRLAGYVEPGGERDAGGARHGAGAGRLPGPRAGLRRGRGGRGGGAGGPGPAALTALSRRWR